MYTPEPRVINRALHNRRHQEALACRDILGSVNTLSAVASHHPFEKVFQLQGVDLEALEVVHAFLDLEEAMGSLREKKEDFYGVVEDFHITAAEVIARLEEVGTDAMLDQLSK